MKREDAGAPAPGRTCIICLAAGDADVCQECVAILAEYLGRPYRRHGLSNNAAHALADRQARAPLFVEGRRALAKQAARARAHAGEAGKGAR